MKGVNLGRKAAGGISGMPGKTHLQAFRNLLILIFLPGLMLLQGCADSHILHHREDVSRNWIYIDFSTNQHPYETESAIGGEHMTFYKVLGFENDEFIVTVKNLEGRVDWGITGDGIRIESLPDAEKKRVFVDASEAIFTLDFSAHPFGRYKLRVEKK